MEWYRCFNAFMVITDDKFRFLVYVNNLSICKRLVIEKLK